MSVHVDVAIENHGSIILFRAASDAGEDWINENIGDEAQFFGGGLVVEPRYAEGVIKGMLLDGLDVWMGGAQIRLKNTTEA